MSKRHTVTLAGERLESVEAEQQRLAEATRLDPSVSEVAHSLIDDGLRFRAMERAGEAKRQKGGK